MAILALYAFWGPMMGISCLGLGIRWLMRKAANARERKAYSRRFRIEIE